jgi:hypothetical protein
MKAWRWESSCPAFYHATEDSNTGNIYELFEPKEISRFPPAVELEWTAAGSVEGHDSYDDDFNCFVEFLCENGCPDEIASSAYEAIDAADNDDESSDDDDNDDDDEGDYKHCEVIAWCNDGVWKFEVSVDVS